MYIVLDAHLCLLACAIYVCSDLRACQVRVFRQLCPLRCVRVVPRPGVVSAV